jgi:hypothetical protein
MNVPDSSARPIRVHKSWYKKRKEKREKKGKKKGNELKNQNLHLTNQRGIYDLVNGETIFQFVYLLIIHVHFYGWYYDALKTTSFKPAEK